MEKRCDITRAITLGLVKYPHQVTGVEWLVTRENDKYNDVSKGGILADEMGLGKTYEILSLIVTNFRKRTLIVIPRSLLEQWESVIYKSLGHKAFIYHGRHSKCSTYELMKYPIVLTTYGMILSRSKSCHSVIWDRIVFDEAHTLRNSSSLVHIGASMLKSDNKWLITGTPIQNRRKDFHSLCEIIGVTSTTYKDIKNLPMIIENCFMRRTLSDVGIELPQLNNITVHVPWGNGSGKKLTTQIHEAMEHSNLYPKIGLYVKAKQCCVMPNIVKTSELSELGIVSPFYSNDSCDKLSIVINTIKSRHYKHGNRKLIFCHYRKEIDYIYYKLSDTMKVSILDGRIQDGAIRRNILTSYNDAIIIQYNSGCDGLNLQEYTDIYFVSPHWNPAVEDQAIARSWRIGQVQPVNVIRFKMSLINDGLTMDHMIHRLQYSKRKDMNMIAEATQADMETGTECIICTTSITQHTIFRGECGHCYHFDCIMMWLKNSHTCPICRAIM